MSWSLTLMGYLARRFFFAVIIVFGALSAIALSLDLADLSPAPRNGAYRPTW